MTDEHPSFKDAAIEAEFETGRREPTRGLAWRHAVMRMGRMIGGSIVVIIGIILLPLPGPGMVVIAVGLTILARDVAWADRMLQRVRERLPEDEHGKLPRSSIVTMCVLGTAGIIFSIWFYFIR